MTKRLWDDFLTDHDKEVIEQSGWGTRGGFGKWPALLVIDVNWAFAGDKPEPILKSIERWSHSCGEESWDAIKVIGALAEAFRDKRLPVIYTTGRRRADGWDSGSWSWKNSRTGESLPGARPGLDPMEIVSDIAPEPQDVLIYKQKPSGFFGTNLAAYLQFLGCDSVIVTGTTTSGCIRATVLDAFSLNYRVAVVEDGCFDRSQASHAINLFDMNAKYADVVPGSEVLSYVETLSDTLFETLPTGGAKPVAKPKLVSAS